MQHYGLVVGPDSYALFGAGNRLQTSLDLVMLALQRGVDWLVSWGGVPRHVAFIMDGNRRYADKEHIHKYEGHTHGYKKMVDVIHWCLHLGVQYISVYAFSIDNYKRTEDEVGMLMRLAEEKYSELMKDKTIKDKYGVEVRVIGDLSLSPESVQAAAARLMQSSMNLKKKQAVLNICFSYSATEELAHAVHDMQQAIHEGSILPEDVSPSLLLNCLYTLETPPVDLLVRTSGETRLSNFLLWQSSTACLYFTKCLWPEFSYVDFVHSILAYQRSRKELEQIRRMLQTTECPGADTCQSVAGNPRALRLLQHRENGRKAWIARLAAVTASSS